MDIVLYSTGNPNSNTLIRKLDDAGLNYRLVTEKAELQKVEFFEAPMLNVGGAVLEYEKAMKWINAQMGE